MLPNWLFACGHRTADHIFSLRTLIRDQCVSHPRKLSSWFVDFKKAYDTIWHQGLLLKLLKYDEVAFYGIISNMYSHLKCCVKDDYTRSEFFDYEKVFDKAVFFARYLCPSGTHPRGRICNSFLSWRSIPHPRARRKRQFPNPKLLIDLIYVFWYIFLIRTKAKRHVFTTFIKVFLSLLREG